MVDYSQTNKQVFVLFPLLRSRKFFNLLLTMYEEFRKPGFNLFGHAFWNRCLALTARLRLFDIVIVAVWCYLESEFSLYVMTLCKKMVENTKGSLRDSEKSFFFSWYDSS